MKRFILSLAMLASFALPATAAAQTAPPACQFTLGFKALHDLDPTNVGDCVDNQFAAAGNGDQQQHTTKGLLAWRKADNWTAFTNGYKTWINGPDGLVSRLNTDPHFAWEKDVVTSPPAAPAAPAPAPVAAAPTSGGLIDISGGWRLQNNQAVYTINEDSDGYIIIAPQQMRTCTASGQSIVPAGVEFKNIKSPMNMVFTGTLNGSVITGNWLVCATVNQSWVPMPITFTLSPDGKHLTGQLQEVLTLDRM